MKKFKVSNGFTLIELLVVISLIGILTGLAIVNLIGVRGRARDAERKSDINTIRSAIELFRADVGSYPTTAQFNILSCNNAFTYSGSTYITAIPCDPLGGTWPVYTYVPAGSPPQTYTMTSCLENANDPAVAGASNCGTNGKVYTVSNP